MAFFVRTKTNRLKRPPHLKEVDVNINDRQNWCGQPHAQVGDYVCKTGGTVSAGTVGRVISIDVDYIQRYIADGHQCSEHYTLGTPAKIEFLDGTQDTIWLWYLTVIDYNAVQEVKDFYINDGRPERIAVNW